uniref:Putative secreted protein n=1 Tax=Anopheles triannulatus TaxID=58253 RepID=A0A2M4B6H8_9DIPT
MLFAFWSCSFVQLVISSTRLAAYINAGLIHGTRASFRRKLLPVAAVSFLPNEATGATLANSRRADGG